MTRCSTKVIKNSQKKQIAINFVYSKIANG